MQDLNDKITGSTLTAQEFVQIPSEQQNFIESTGQTLSGGDLLQTAKGIASVATRGGFCIDSGAVNAYVLEPEAPLTRIPALKNGMRFYGSTSNANTGATTVNTHGLGILPIVNKSGGALSGGEISSSFEIEFDLSNNRFLLLNSFSSNRPSVSGSTVFINSTNNIALTGVGLLDDLEVDDVIQISGTSNNDGLYTVDVITDANNIIVNQAHAAAAHPKTLTDETVTCTITLFVKWYNASPEMGRDWIALNISTERSLSTTYTNSSKRGMWVIVTAAGSASVVSFSVSISVAGGFGFSTNTGSGGESISCISFASPGVGYSAGGVAVALNHWKELR